MDITEELVKEFGQKLLSNELFLNELAAKLTNIVDAETLLKSKPSKLKKKIRANRSQKSYTTLATVFDSYEIIDYVSMKPLLEQLLIAEPVEPNYYPIGLFIHTVGKLILGDINKWNGSGLSDAIIAGALSRFDLIDPSPRSNEYGYSYYEIERKTCKNIRCVKIKKLKYYQKFLVSHLGTLLNDIDRYKDFQNNKVDTLTITGDDLIEDPEMTFEGYTDFLDHISLFTEEELKAIQKKTKSFWVL